MSQSCCYWSCAVVCVGCLRRDLAISWHTLIQEYRLSCYLPETNGLVERAHRHLKVYLAASDNLAKWAHLSRRHFYGFRNPGRTISDVPPRSWCIVPPCASHLNMPNQAITAPCLGHHPVVRKEYNFVLRINLSKAFIRLKDLSPAYLAAGGDSQFGHLANHL